jgi:hypothetical protein
MLHAVDLPDVNIHPKTIPAISKAAEFDVLRYKNEFTLTMQGLVAKRL